MKIIKYVLNEDGTIPSFIVDGGYFPVSNKGNSPQDFNFVGMTFDEIEADFANRDELISYVDANNFYFENLLTNQSIPNEEVVTSLWQKWEANVSTNA